MANQVTKPTNAQVQHATKKLEIGWMGFIFGDATEKPGNIAGMAMLLGFAGIIAVAIWMPEGTSKASLLSLFGSIITGAVGFVFGRTTS
ncbi:hypothetical protein [Bradyrhizobium sp. Cp5.3]|uniref:hypothetical protein n=1 Tax=Bradyrhizobium sp. Cp5.3 TaxID=443598 RepID=UPI00047F7AB8|nr:hypothetical protein [Bradyrhizobium sp. Cp5.3]